MDANTKVKDFTPGGMKINGAYENDRNADCCDLLKSIIREAYGVTDVIIGHHLVFVRTEKRTDGFTYQVVEEVPSLDALIFDHSVAQRIFGRSYLDVLQQLAVEPVATRDTLLERLYFGRKMQENGE